MHARACNTTQWFLASLLLISTQTLVTFSDPPHVCRGSVSVVGDKQAFVDQMLLISVDWGFKWGVKGQVSLPPLGAGCLTVAVIFLRVSTFLSAPCDCVFTGSGISLTDAHFSNESLLMAAVTFCDGPSEVVALLSSLWHIQPQWKGFPSCQRCLWMMPFITETLWALTVRGEITGS